ncbi:MAG TPA: hypothetical protein QGG18_09475 [Rhodospirillales bacterium]|nr:hypothetical protein [Rhodospirillales bacterium]
MKYYVGLDVSHKQTAICVIEGSGAGVWRGSVDTHANVLNGANIGPRWQSWNERRLDFATARGIIIAALETLATCYGYIGMDKKRRL